MAKNDLCNNDNIDKDTNDITNDNNEVLGPGEPGNSSQINGQETVNPQVLLLLLKMKLYINTIFETLMAFHGIF